jgi:hypothetical protein
VDEGIPARDEEDADKIGSKDDLDSIEIDLSSKDKFNIVVGLEFNKTSLLVYSSIDRGIG